MSEPTAPVSRGSAAAGSTVNIDAAALPASDRVEALRAAISQLVVRVDIEQPPPQAVDARCQLRTLGAVTDLAGLAAQYAARISEASPR